MINWQRAGITQKTTTKSKLYYMEESNILNSIKSSRCELWASCKRCIYSVSVYLQLQLCNRWKYNLLWTEHLLFITLNYRKYSDGTFSNLHPISTDQTCWINLSKTSLLMSISRCFYIYFHVSMSLYVHAHTETEKVTNKQIP